MNFSAFLDLIGFSRHRTNYREKIISTVGGFLGIFGILMTSYWLLDPDVAVLIVPSMGASAVLLFAAPHVPFSQPWNVLGGHAFSAIVGVACWQLIPDYTIAASASVFPEDRKKAESVGCQAFIPKPIDINVLLGEIKKLLDINWKYE